MLDRIEYLWKNRQCLYIILISEIEKIHVKVELMDTWIMFLITLKQ